MQSVGQFLHTPTSRDQARSAVDQIAETLGCRADVLLAAARTERFPDEKAELVRLWFKLRSLEERSALLEQARALASKRQRVLD